MKQEVVMKNKKRVLKKKIKNRTIVLSGVLIAFAILFILRASFKPVTYQVARIYEDGKIELKGSYPSFAQAKKDMDTYIDKDKKINAGVFTNNNHLLAIGYGVVNFQTKTCGENTQYTTDSGDGYLNGCYAGEGAYLDTSADGSKIQFKLAGIVGWVPSADVTLHNYFDGKEVASVNHYQVNKDEFMHWATLDMQKQTYAIQLPMSDIPKGIGNVPYYSYDGNYFYESFIAMIDDYRNQTYKNSVNATTPFYNYYQYVSHRSTTSYLAKDIDDYIKYTLNISSLPAAFPMKEQESLLYGSGAYFIDAQNTYGANAIMMFALAMNESNYGKSSIAYEKNNVFGHAAYDDSPGSSANKYNDINASIQTHAKVFLNGGYLHPCAQATSTNACSFSKKDQYRGSFFGDKASGMNVRYASDPYWGEKAANLYRKFDAAMGYKDKKSIPLHVVKQVDNVPIYQKADASSSVLYTTGKLSNYTFLVRKEVKGTSFHGSTKWYQIQSDAALNDAQNEIILQPSHYRIEQDVGYIPAAYLDK